jgi:hypothetical protein
MENMRAQTVRFGAEMIDDDIVEVDLTGDIKTVTDAAGTVRGAKAVIVATRSGQRKLGLPLGAVSLAPTGLRRTRSQLPTCSQKPRRWRQRTPRPGSVQVRQASADTHPFGPKLASSGFSPLSRS